jgi:hypothetical protein
MSSLRIVFRLILAWVALLIAQMVAGMVIHVTAPPVAGMMPWLMLANAGIVLALGAAALRSDWRDWKLAVAMFAVPASIAIVNMIEGVFFLTNSHIDWRGVIEITLAGFAIAAMLWWLIYRGAPVVSAAMDSPLPHRSFGQIVNRVILCLACYVFLYYLAGFIIFPYVRDFYATQRLPGVGEIVAMQFLLRGPIFLMVCLLLLRMFRLPHLAGALAVGLAFTVLSGVAPLIVPNPFFPDAVRWVHFGEVTSSNFVFGCIVGWVWGRAQQVAHLSPARA